MSKNTKRSPEEKMEIVLEGLQNDNISETCRKHGIYESQFYQWKKRLIGSAGKVFRNKKKKDFQFCLDFHMQLFIFSVPMRAGMLLR